MLEHSGFPRWLDRGLSMVERASVDRLSLEPRHPPLLVVGPPRCGTTALFLALVNHFQLSFFPNVSKRHPRAPLSYALLGQLMGGYQPTFSNRFGIVGQAMAPSDGWDIFLRWLPNTYGAEVPGDGGRQLRTLARLLERLLGGPLCVRNNVNSLRLQLMTSLFPGAITVAITRDWREAALSLREAYREHDTPPGEWWSAGPPDYDANVFEDDLEKAVFQILGVEAIVRRDLPRLDPSRTLQIPYEEFCADPGRVLEWVEGAYARAGVTLDRRPGNATRGVRRSGRWSNPDARGGRAMERMESYGRRFLDGSYLPAQAVLTSAVRGRVGVAP